LNWAAAVTGTALTIQMPVSAVTIQVVEFRTVPVPTYGRDRPQLPGV
jgi:hypothetical protein